MGQMIKITYIGAFIVPVLDKFQEISREDDFYDSFYENGNFRTAYQGLEKIDVLIPTGKKYAIKDEDNEEEYILTSFDTELILLERKLYREYKEVIDKLTEKFPTGKFNIASGIVSYWDEIA